MYHGDAPPDILDNPQHPNELTQQQQYALDRPTIREMSGQEIDVLLHTANDRAKLLIALLLSGVTLEEISAIQEDDVDFDKDKLMIAGSSSRTIPLNHAVKLLFANLDFSLTDPSGEPLTSDDLAALLTCAVIDGGLSAPDEMNAVSFRHTYIIYLVKQGIRLSDLELIMGYIAPTELSSYRVYSPPGQGRPFNEIDWLYPSFRMKN